MPEAPTPHRARLSAALLATLVLTTACGGPGGSPSLPPEPSVAGAPALEVPSPEVPEAPAPEDPDDDSDPHGRIPDGGELVRSYCGACHGLELVESQRLDRNTWNWVLEDMIEEYGARWVTEEERRRILDHLVEHYGPEP